MASREELAEFLAKRRNQLERLETLPGQPPEAVNRVVKGVASGLAKIPQKAFEVSQAWRQGEKSPAMAGEMFDIAQIPTSGAAPLAVRGAAGAGGGKLITPSREIIKPTKAETLFDYSKIHEVPDVAQFPLPRYEPRHGISERVADLVKNPRVRNEMLDYLEKGKSIGQAPYFYNTMPLRDAFVAELGAKRGPAAHGTYLDFGAGTSVRSDVPVNARNASYYYMLDAQGRPMPSVGTRNPYPYGHFAQKQHQRNAIDIDAGTWDFIKNPKPPSYATNLRGNYMPVTVDAHAIKLPAMLSKDPRFLAGSYTPEKGAATINPAKLHYQGKLTMGEALKDPKFWVAQPNPNEYAAMEEYYRGLSREVGFPAPAMGQASGWAAGGEKTGLGSVAGDPFLKSFEDRVRLTRDKRAPERSQPVSLEEQLSRFIRGKESLLGIGGTVAAGGIPYTSGYMGELARQDQYQ